MKYSGIVFISVYGYAMTIKRTAAKSRDSRRQAAEKENHMSTYYIRSLEQAKAIIAA